MSLDGVVHSILKNPELKEKCRNNYVAFNGRYKVIALECNPERAYFEAVAKGCDAPIVIPLRCLSV